MEEKALERLLKITWNNEPNRFRSHAALAQEYFRRLMLWSQALNIEPPLRLEIFRNLAYIINPSVQPKAQSLQMLEEHLKKQSPFREAYVLAMCRLYLYWAALEETDQTASYNLPAPYEPMIRLFERHGPLNIDQGYLAFDLGGISLPYPEMLDRIRNHPPLLDLNDEILDRFDQAPL